MVSVFSKKLLVAPVAGILLSLGASAGDFQGQAQGQVDQTQQCAPIMKERIVPEAPKPWVEVEETEHYVTYLITGHTTITKVGEIHTNLSQQQGYVLDGCQFDHTQEVPKCDTPDQDQSAQQTPVPNNGENLTGENGVTTASAGMWANGERVEHYTHRLTYHSGDADSYDLPLTKMNPEIFWRDLKSKHAQGWCVRDLEAAYQKLMTEGKLTVRFGGCDNACSDKATEKNSDKSDRAARKTKREKK